MHNTPTNEDLSLVMLVGFIRDTWKNLVVGAISGVILLYAASHLVTPKYESEILVRYRTEIDNLGASSSGSGTIKSISSLLGGGAGSGSGGRDPAMAIATSRSFIFSFFKDENIMPILFAGKWDSDKKDWNSDDPQERPSLLDGYYFFKNKILSIEDDTLHNLITVKIEWRDNKIAEKWVNAYISRLNNYIKLRKANEASKNVEFLTQEITTTSIADVRGQLTALLEKQIEQQMLMNAYDDYAFEILDPGIASDDENFASPKRAIWMAVGMILGLIGGFFLSLWRKLSINLPV